MDNWTVRRGEIGRTARFRVLWPPVKSWLGSCVLLDSLKPHNGADILQYLLLQQEMEWTLLDFRMTPNQGAVHRVGLLFSRLLRSPWNIVTQISRNSTKANAKFCPQDTARPCNVQCGASWLGSSLAERELTAVCFGSKDTQPHPKLSKSKRAASRPMKIFSSPLYCACGSVAGLCPFWDLPVQGGH